MTHLNICNGRKLICLCLLFGASTSAFPQESDPAAASDDQQMKLWREVYAEVAQWHTFSVGQDTPEEARFHPQPLHTYANPAGGSQSHGSIFLWTRDDRPVVIGALWSLVRKDTRQIKASLHSASSDELTGRRKGEQFWHPRQEFHLIAWPSKTPPADTALKRLVQMRNMMSSIQAMRTVNDRESQLRCLPQPLYRYQNETILDGAMFGFFDNWDPEVFILVEVSAAQPDRWKVGMVRFSDKKLDVRYKDQTLWQYDPEGKEPRLGGVDFLYISQTIDTRPDRIEPSLGTNNTK
jgi:hypothetical protein